MNTPLWKRDEIESPCVQICIVHPETRICTGCYRTIDEITDWSRMTPEARRNIMDDLPARADQLKVRRGGRAARLKRRKSTLRPNRSGASQYSTNPMLTALLGGNRRSCGPLAALWPWTPTARLHANTSDEGHRPRPHSHALRLGYRC